MVKASDFSKPRQFGDALIVAISLLTDEELRMMTAADLLDLIRMSHTVQSPLVSSVSFKNCAWQVIHDFALVARDLCRFEHAFWNYADDSRPAFSVN